MPAPIFLHLNWDSFFALFRCTLMVFDNQKTILCWPWPTRWRGNIFVKSTDLHDWYDRSDESHEMSQQQPPAYLTSFFARHREIQPVWPGPRTRGSSDSRDAGGDLGQEVLRWGRSDVCLREDLPAAVPGGRGSGENSQNQTDNFIQLLRWSLHRLRWTLSGKQWSAVQTR